MQLAMDQTTRVKKFVDMLPAHLLPKGEVSLKSKREVSLLYSWIFVPCIYTPSLSLECSKACAFPFSIPALHLARALLKFRLNRPTDKLFFFPSKQTETIIHFFAPAAADMDVKTLAQDNEDGAYRNPQDSAEEEGPSSDQADGSQFKPGENGPAVNAKTYREKFPGSQLSHFGPGSSQEDQHVPPSPVPITPTPWAIKMAPPRAE